MKEKNTMCYVIKKMSDVTFVDGNKETKQKNVVTFVGNRKTSTNKYLIGTIHPTFLRSTQIGRELEKDNHVDGSFSRVRRVLLFFILRHIKINTGRTYNIEMIDKDLIILNTAINEHSRRDVFKIDRIQCV